MYLTRTKCIGGGGRLVELFAERAAITYEKQTEVSEFEHISEIEINAYGFNFGKKFALGRIVPRGRYLLRTKTIRPITSLSLIISLTILSIIGLNSWRKLPCGRRLEELKSQQLF